MIFPNDVNGDVLRRMEARADDLTRPRNIDFAVVFADAISADQFAEHFLALGFAVSVRETATEEDFPWDVIVVKHMAPSYGGITDFENLLQSVADGWNGHNEWLGLFLPAEYPLRGWPPSCLGEAWITLRELALQQFSNWRLGERGATYSPA